MNILIDSSPWRDLGSIKSRFGPSRLVVGLLWGDDGRESYQVPAISSES